MAKLASLLAAATLATAAPVPAPQSPVTPVPDEDARADSACLLASGLSTPKVSKDKASFSGDLRVELRIVEGFDQNAVAQVRLCAFDPKSENTAFTKVVGRLGGLRSNSTKPPVGSSVGASVQSSDELICQMSGDCLKNNQKLKERPSARGFTIARPRNRPSHLPKAAEDIISTRFAVGHARLRDSGIRQAELDNTTFLPWPPPRPTSLTTVSSIPIRGTYGSVIGNIVARIQRSGYHNARFFAVPNGVGLVTQIEKIGPSPIDPAFRWNSLSASSAASFSDYIRRLFFGNEGRYYVAVILVTDGPVTPSTEHIKLEDVTAWRARGEYSISERRAALPTTAMTRISVLNYEFDAAPGTRQQLSPLLDGGTIATKHLARLNLL